MPELIRLQTPFFEFSVWTSDISQRAKTYQSTLLKRNIELSGFLDVSDKLSRVLLSNSGAISLKSSATHKLRFSPEVELIDVSVTTTAELFNQNSNDTQKDDFSTGISSPVKCDSLALDFPLFFENTNYNFEWIFFHNVSDGFLTHRSQRINEHFRFTRRRGPIPARLTGSINTGNNVGWLKLPLNFLIEGNSHAQNISFEVLPTKLLLHHDLPIMYREIDKTYPLWRFSIVEKTEQDVAASKQRSLFPLMWLANFTNLRERFEKGIEVICSAPHSRLQVVDLDIKADRLKGRLSRKLTERMKQDFVNGRCDRRYRVERKKLSVDTPENRFIKMVVEKSKRRLYEFEYKLRDNNQAPDHERLSESFLDELHSWQQPLKKALNNSFLKDVSSYSGSTRESLVLQQKTGYSAVYQVWQELRFYLEAIGDNSSISMKSVAEIYEIWCFLCLKNILENDLGFHLVDNSETKLSGSKFFEYQLKDGLAGAFCFKRSDGVVARLAHEPVFTKHGNPIRSYLVSQEPDIILEVTLPSKYGNQEEKQFIWIFDAKYRIKTTKNRYDDKQEDITKVDYVPDDAINQMHRYRDALIRLSELDVSGSTSTKTDGNSIYSAKKSRPIFGAFALYPGFFVQTQEQNPYSSAIEEIGIGAFALLPCESKEPEGYKWLLNFLTEQIGINLNLDEQMSMKRLSERIYVNEAARIPSSGMRQILYPNLSLTAALGGQKGREVAYFHNFEHGMAAWYHMPSETFTKVFEQHVINEIRYLALATEPELGVATKSIVRLWPVKSVVLKERRNINVYQAGSSSQSERLYYLFELGKPLTLQQPISGVASSPFLSSMKLVTLDQLNEAKEFAHLQSVYREALAKSPV